MNWSTCGIGLGIVLIAALAAEFCDALHYSPKAVALIDRLRRAIGTGALCRDYMTSDDFLITWLCVQGMDLLRARDMLQKSLRWRRVNKIDSILTEDLFSRLLFPVSVEDSIDRAGRPLLMFRYGAWNVSNVASEMATRKQALRYMDQVFERTAQAVRNRNATSPYQNVTQMTSIIDVEGYTRKQHACIGCIGIYKKMMDSYSMNYPGLEHKLILINTPDELEKQLLRILRPFMTKEQKEALVIFGPSQEEWRKYLAEVADDDQLPTQFGGTKVIDL